MFFPAIFFGIVAIVLGIRSLVFPSERAEQTYWVAVALFIFFEIIFVFSLFLR